MTEGTLRNVVELGSRRSTPELEAIAAEVKARLASALAVV